MMDSIRKGDIILLGGVSLLSAYQLAIFVRRVGASRMKFNIYPPVTDGDPEFVRTFRAQQNSVEHYPMYLTMLCTSGIFFHQVPSAVVGLYYIYGREKYFNGYVKEAEQRWPGFRICVRCYYMLLLMSTAGVVHTSLKHFLSVDVVQIVRNAIKL